MWYLAHGNSGVMMTEPFVSHFCSFIVATGGSVVLYCRLSWFKLSSCLAKLACFSLRLRGKSALCRSADKGFLLVTHCLTHTHTHMNTNFLNPPNVVTSQLVVPSPNQPATVRAWYNRTVTVLWHPYHWKQKKSSLLLHLAHASISSSFITQSINVRLYFGLPSLWLPAWVIALMRKSNH